MPRKNRRPHPQYHQQSSTFEYRSVESMRNDFDLNNAIFFERKRGGEQVNSIMPVYVSIHNISKERMNENDSKIFYISGIDDEFSKIKSDRVKVGVVKALNGEKRLYIIEDEKGYKITKGKTRRKVQFTVTKQDRRILSDFTGSHDGFLYDSKHDLYYLESIVKS